MHLLRRNVLRGPERRNAMDRMIEIATFVKAVEAGGFAAASRKLGMSPSTVTVHIQDLEQQLGARLLNRSTRKISLTEVGKAYYERCLQILADVDEADNVVQALQSTPRGTLRLNVSIGIPQLLAPVIAEFTSLYPDVRLNVVMTDRMVNMIEEGMDLAIRLLPVPDSSLIVRRIGSFRVQVFGAPNYFKAHGHPRQPGDLAKHNCLSYSFSPWGSGWTFDREDGEETVHVSGNVESNSFETLKLAAVRGQGLIRTACSSVAEEVKTGQLIPVLKEFVRTERAINAIYPHRLHLSAKVRSFIDLATRHFREASDPVADNVISPVSSDTYQLA
jgi:DNA-binding transcriptional LysR family regulator